MRALAAIWVLLHHANVSVRHFVGPLPAGDGLIANGYIGVDFFFVLSGFIIAFSANRLLQTGRGFADYAKARAIRIYVPYLPVGLGMLALYTLLPDVSAGERSPGLLTSLMLLPSSGPPALSVAWTLVHEMLFYALFSTIFASRRLLAALLVVWACAIVWTHFAVATPERPAGYVLAPINLCFLLGVATYYGTRAGVSPVVGALGLALGVATLAMEAAQTDPRRWLLALGFAGFIVAATSAWAQRRGPGAVALFLGAASYSIYLVHDPVLSAAVRLLTRAAPGVAPPVAFVAVAVTALLTGVTYYAAYERRALSVARRRFLDRPTRVPDDGAAIAPERP